LGETVAGVLQGVAGRAAVGRSKQPGGD